MVISEYISVTWSVTTLIMNNVGIVIINTIRKDIIRALIFSLLILLRIFLYKGYRIKAIIKDPDIGIIKGRNIRKETYIIPNKNAMKK